MIYPKIAIYRIPGPAHFPPGDAQDESSHEAYRSPQPPVLLSPCQPHLQGMSVLIAASALPKIPAPGP